MVARARPERGMLVAVFTRDGEEPETRHAIDGRRAAATAITMIAARLTLQPGDILTCHRADEPELQQPLFMRED